MTTYRVYAAIMECLAAQVIEAKSEEEAVRIFRENAMRHGLDIRGWRVTVFPQPEGVNATEFWYRGSYDYR
jgi:hypothetical protein